MIKRYIALSLLAFHSLVTSVHADTQRMTELFHTLFHSGYEARQCGSNIMGLLDAARTAGIDANRARMIFIRNDGFSAFGMVNAEKARRGLHFRTDEQLPPGETNWYHHVILEYDCQIYDFDFMNSATVLPMAQYFDSMFLEEKRDPAPGMGFYVGRDRKLEEYAVDVYLGSGYYADPRGVKPTEKMLLKHLLETCQPL